MISRSSKKKFQPVLLLFLIPLLVLCWPAFYDFRDPQLVGIPFFYWFQMFWILFTASITGLVYLLEA